MNNINQNPTAQNPRNNINQKENTMQITVRDILSALEGIDPNTPIQIAFQPNHPITAQITRIAADDEGNLTIEGYGREDYYQRNDLDGNLLDY